MATKPTIVLVPGAWHFPSCFEILVKRLKAEGYPTRTVAHASIYKGDPPKIIGLQDDVQTIRDVVLPLIDEGKEIIVFAHSYGGTPTTEALAGLGKAKQVGPANNNENGGVIHIIYCAAFVHKEGTSQIEMNMTNPDGWAGHWLNFSEDMSKSWVGKEHAVEALYADVPQDVAEQMVNQLGDMVATVSTTPLGRCAWREIQCTYILCEEDKAIFPIFQERMANSAGIQDIVRLPGCSHSPFLSQPEKVVQVIDRVANAKSTTHL